VEGHLLMSAKERRRKSVFDRVGAGELTLVSASKLLKLSYRHTLRAYARYGAEGDAGLVHKSRGRPGNRAVPKRRRQKILARYEARYKGFGPTLAAEKLAEAGLEVDHETLRRWLVAAGLWQKRRKRNQHRAWRERKAHFGELVQIDGSHHRWFGEDRAEYCLFDLVDDATGKTLSLLGEEETTELAMRALWLWIEKYGVPKALYADKKTVFVTDREPTLEEQLAGEEPKTAFGKSCAKLGVEIISAHSPQAKGRVERTHAVYQDRFLKELKLRRITTIETANRLLTGGFADSLNRRFALAPRSGEDFHRPLDKGIDLADVFCFEQWRTLQNDWTIRYENAYYQILPENRPLPKPKEKILVRIRLDGTLHLLYRDRPLAYTKLRKRDLHRRPTNAPEKNADPRPPLQKPKTPSHSPWRQAVSTMFANHSCPKQRFVT
jgi:transposase